MAKVAVVKVAPSEAGLFKNKNIAFSATHTTQFSSVDRELWRQRPVFDFVSNKTSKKSQFFKSELLNNYNSDFKACKIIC